MRKLLFAIFLMCAGASFADEEPHEACEDMAFFVTVAKAANYFEYRTSNLIEEKYQRLKEAGPVTKELEKRKIQELAILKKVKSLKVCEEEDVLELIDMQTEEIARKTQRCLDLKSPDAFLEEETSGTEVIVDSLDRRKLRSFRRKFLDLESPEGKCAVLVKAVNTLTFEFP